MYAEERWAKEMVRAERWGKRKRSYPVPKGLRVRPQRRSSSIEGGLLQRDYLIDRDRGLEDVLDDGL